MNAKFLNEQDRIKAVKRVAENKTGIKDSTWKLSQAIEATLDIKIWLLVIIQTATNVANGGVQSVSTTKLEPHPSKTVPDHHQISSAQSSSKVSASQLSILSSSR